MTHQKSIESAASYALGALDPGERAEFEAHLAGCAECQGEVASYREVASALAHTAAPMSPPGGSGLRDRVLREARQVRPIRAGAARQRKVSVSPRAPALAWLIASTGIAASLVLGFVYRAERQREAKLQTELASVQTTLAREDSTLAAFLGPEVHVVSLTAATEQKPRVRVFWNHTQKRFIVTALDLPPAPPGKTYQLWAMRKGKAPLSMGTFVAAAS